MKLGFTRILIAPGTPQMANGGPDERTTPGDNYVMDHLYPITFSGGSPNAVQAQGRLRRDDGSLGPVELELPGAWYAAADAEAPPPVAR
jgi:hypothetical protein